LPNADHFYNSFTMRVGSKLVNKVFTKDGTTFICVVTLYFVKLQPNNNRAKVLLSVRQRMFSFLLV